MTDSLTCQRCGETHTQCAGHNREGKPCGRNPAEYQRVCDRHGGKSPQALKQAARRKAAAIVTQAYQAEEGTYLAAEGIEPIADPVLELGKLAAEAVHWKNMLGAKVNQLVDLVTTNKEGTEQLQAEITLYERAIDRTAKLLQLLIAAGFEERRVKIDEQTAHVFNTVMAAVLDKLGLTQAQLEMAPALILQELNALDE